MDLGELIRDVPDFPSDGIMFKDISPLLAHPTGLATAAAAMSEPFGDARVTTVVGIEARGFLFGPLIAQLLGVGFTPIRKPGKLPPETIHVDYALEYGSDRMEMRSNALASSDRVLLVDDVLATGGTLRAASTLVNQTGASLVGISVLIELVALQGRRVLPDVVFSAPIEVH